MSTDKNKLNTFAAF